MTRPLLSHCSFSKRKLGTHGPREPFNPKQTWTSVCVPGPEPQGALGPQTCPCKELSIISGRLLARRTASWGWPGTHVSWRHACLWRTYVHSPSHPLFRVCDLQTKTP